MSEPLNLRVILGSSERRGPWTVPAQLNARVVCGSMELDLREAELGPVTTINARVALGSLEVIVPRDLIVEVAVDAIAGSVENGAHTVEPAGDASSEPLAVHAYRDPAGPAAKRLRVTGNALLASCEIIPLGPGETIHDHARRMRQRMHRQHRHHHHHHRHHDWHAEKVLWKTQPGRSKWLPWWLQAQMRRRIFSWFAIAFAVGVAAGVHLWGDRHWWHFVLAALGLFMMSGFVSWRLTRPLLLVVRAARDIGDGKLDTRLEVRGRGEMRVLATAINDMASRIEQQIKDQRQLLAAVSHELRTPLGHMRVLVETARTKPDPKILDELDREVMTIDDLVGRLLA